MKGVDHLVLCGADLEAMRERYRSLGFMLTPPARHPFGTGNSLIQLDGCFLELLTVLDPTAVPEHRPGHFSFGAFNRDFLSHGEGFSMLVLSSEDARADTMQWRRAGLDTHAPFDFSRKAKLPSGEDVTVGFSLAFATHPEMPRAGFFTCEQHMPEYFWKAEYQRHPNTAATVLEVCLVAAAPEPAQSFIARLTGVEPVGTADGTRFATARGDILIMGAQAFAERYGSRPPPLTEGPRFAGYTIVLRSTAFINTLGLRRAGNRWLVPSNEAFGTAIAFAGPTRQ